MSLAMKVLHLGVVLFVSFFISSRVHAGEGLEVGKAALSRNGKEIGYLFGAEVQYFRARGGSGRNVPKEVVVKLWNTLLDRVSEAGMNTVTLYIPWDFHEPVEGVFDFDGTLDQDHDGRADYPSRDIKGFLRLLESRGLTHVMVRPGPYINAEWGPEGFGAVPKWFLDTYPEALTGSRTPGRPRTVSFGHPKFRDHAAHWLTKLQTEVLKDFIGPGKIISFIQIDNESNYFWDSIYERDISLTGLARYATFLQHQYGGSIANLNKAYQANVKSFSEVAAPISRDDHRYAGSRWLYDWALFHDVELRDYYRFLRETWTRLGVVEPQVIFTSCDSFNAPDHGLLPRLDFRQGDKLSLTTMNIYPKTFGTQAESTLNTPMKAAHDASLVASSHRQYYGAADEWVMSTETVGGWFAPVEVSLATRQHTYGSLLGAGIKAMSIYYFHEGWNWNGREGDDGELKFDAPLDKDMRPRPSFTLLKNLGQSLKNGLGADIMATKELHAPVLIAHDSHAQYNGVGPEDALKIASTDSAALYGLFREAGATPEVAFVDAMNLSELETYRLVVWHHPGYITTKTKALFEQYVKRGGTLLMIGDFQLSDVGLGQVVYKKTNPAEGWNSDAYLKLPNIDQTLRWTRDLLTSLSIQPAVKISAIDEKPFLHATVRQGRDKLLVVIENFLPESRVARLQLRKDVLPVKSASKFKILRKLSAEDTAPFLGTVTVSRTQLVNDGVELPVSIDGVDIWELVPVP